MSPKPRKTAVKKTAKKTTKSATQPTAKTGPTALSGKSPEEIAAAIKAARTPEELREQSKQFMGKMLGEISKVNAQIGFLGRNHTNLVTEINEQLGYIDTCLAALFKELHIEQPQRMPRLIDAQVELVTTLNEGEICEMQASFSEKQHPVYGHFQIVLGAGDQVEARNLNSMHPIIQKRLVEAFDALKQSGDLQLDQFYFVRLGLVHNKPVSAESVQIAGDPQPQPNAPTEVAHGG
jgi:hypothetical protein